MGDTVVQLIDVATAIHRNHMPDHPCVEQVRQLIRDSFKKAIGAVPITLQETLLIAGGHYCGHRFTCSGASAVWFVEEDQIKIYSADGSLLESLSPSQSFSSDGLKRAA